MADEHNGTGKEIPYSWKGLHVRLLSGATVVMQKNQEGQNLG